MCVCIVVDLWFMIDAGHYPISTNYEVYLAAQPVPRRLLRRILVLFRLGSEHVLGRPVEELSAARLQRDDGLGVEIGVYGSEYDTLKC